MEITVMKVVMAKAVFWEKRWYSRKAIVAVK